MFEPARVFEVRGWREVYPASSTEGEQPQLIPAGRELVHE